MVDLKPSFTVYEAAATDGDGDGKLNITEANEFIDLIEDKDPSVISDDKLDDIKERIEKAIQEDSEGIITAEDFELIMQSVKFGDDDVDLVALDALIQGVTTDINNVTTEFIAYEAAATDGGDDGKLDRDEAKDFIDLIEEKNPNVITDDKLAEIKLAIEADSDGIITDAEFNSIMRSLSFDKDGVDGFDLDELYLAMHDVTIDLNNRQPSIDKIGESVGIIGGGGGLINVTHAVAALSKGINDLITDNLNYRDDLEGFEEYLQVSVTQSALEGGNDKLLDGKEFKAVFLEMIDHMGIEEGDIAKVADGVGNYASDYAGLLPNTKAKLVELGLSNNNDLIDNNHGDTQQDVEDLLYTAMKQCIRPDGVFNEDSFQEVLVAAGYNKDQTLGGHFNHVAARAIRRFAMEAETYDPKLVKFIFDSDDGKGTERDNALVTVMHAFTFDQNNNKEVLGDLIDKVGNQIQYENAVARDLSESKRFTSDALGDAIHMDHAYAADSDRTGCNKDVDRVDLRHIWEKHMGTD